MVKTDPTDLFAVMRWGGFFTLSVIINLYVMTLIKLPVPHLVLPTPEKIRLAFMTLAAAKVSPVSPEPAVVKKLIEKVMEKEVPKQVPTKTVVDLLPVETTKYSDKKIVMAKVTLEKIVSQKQLLQKISDIKPVPTPRLLFKKAKRKKPTKESPERASEHTLLPKKNIEREQAEKEPPLTKRVPAKAVQQANLSVGNNSGADVSTVIQKAKIRRRSPPVYPRRAYELGQQGLVMLHALVAPNGVAQRFKIETTSGHRMLDKAALAAVKKWEFEPHLKNGLKIQSWVSVPVQFVIR